jgi:hypothetical protein
MRIKSGQGNAVVTKATIKPSKTVVLSKPMGTVMSPALVIKQGWIGRRVQGGHAPVPYRSRSADWGMANKRARA